MAGSLIIETKTEANSWQKQYEAHMARVAYYQLLGYTIQDKGNGEFWIIPKNAATGEDDFDAMPTKLWAEPGVTPETTYEIPMPSDVVPTFTGAFETDYTIRERPPEWTAGYDGEDFNSQYDAGDFDV